MTNFTYPSATAVGLVSFWAPKCARQQGLDLALNHWWEHNPSWSVLMKTWEVCADVCEIKLDQQGRQGSRLGGIGSWWSLGKSIVDTQAHGVTMWQVQYSMGNSTGHSTGNCAMNVHDKWLTDCTAICSPCDIIYTWHGCLVKTHQTFWWKVRSGKLKQVFDSGCAQQVYKLCCTVF
jgi:hypothetical protein